MEKISKATLRRYPVYLKALRKLSNQGVKRVLSSQLAQYVDIKSTTIRRDFSLIGQLGKQGYGYDVDQLIEVFSKELGKDFDEKIVLIGVGRLGSAILNYNNWNHVAGEIVCAFDLLDKKPELEQNSGIPVYDIRDLKEKLPHDCEIALLCISSNVQEVVDALSRNGIKGIVSFSSEHFVAPDGVIVYDVDVVSFIQEMIFEVNALRNKKK